LWNRPIASGESFHKGSGYFSDSDEADRPLDVCPSVRLTDHRRVNLRICHRDQRSRRQTFEWASLDVADEPNRAPYGRVTCANDREAWPSPPRNIRVAVANRSAHRNHRSSGSHLTGRRDTRRAPRPHARLLRGGRGPEAADCDTSPRQGAPRTKVVLIHTELYPDGHASVPVRIHCCMRASTSAVRSARSLRRGLAPAAGSAGCGTPGRRCSVAGHGPRCSPQCLDGDGCCERTP
jgi:hypothetical protein